MKIIYLDFDDTLVHYGNYLFKGVNEQLKADEVFNEIKLNKFHVSKIVIKKFIELSDPAGHKLIEKLLEDVNSHFEIEEDKLITLDNMNRRHQKMKAFFKEFEERETDIVEKMNKFFIDKKSYKEVALGNISKMEEELNKYYQGNEMGYYENAKVFPQMFEFLGALKKAGYAIKIVTSSMSDDQRDWKTKWIKTHINDYINGIIYANQKYKYTTDGVFIDDKLKHIKGHIENSEHRGILFNPHKEDIEPVEGVNICNDYNEVLALLGMDPINKMKNSETNSKTP